MTDPSSLSARDVIGLLGLKPHPEGGHYRETFRDPAETQTGRAASTAILFLLQAGEVSRWHTVDAAEAWHWHAGAPLELGIAAPGEPATLVQIGFDPAAGVLPQAIVPAGHWQQARSTGNWTLVGCTVAPGFSFFGFKMAPPDAQPPLA